MQKSEEYGAKSKFDVKPRNLFNPHETIKAVLGLINFNMIKLVKLNNPSFIHGCNTSQLEDRFQESLHTLSDPVMVKWDGSAYDAH